MNNIESMAFFLRLPNIRKRYKEMIEDSLSKQLSYEQFLELILKEECNLRNQLSIERKIKNAKNAFTEKTES